jgi:hypothetical protein
MISLRNDIMTINEFLENLTEEYGTAEFEYKGKKCGIEPKTQDSITTYTMWYGKNWNDYDDIDILLSDRFFDGRSLHDIFQSIEVYF